MALPTQILFPLAALGGQAAEVEERLVRGVGPERRNNKLSKLISAVLWPQPKPDDEQIH